MLIFSLHTSDAYRRLLSDGKEGRKEEEKGGKRKEGREIETDDINIHHKRLYSSVINPHLTA